MPKDKKKKNEKKKSSAGTASATLRTLSKNPLVADVVAAALVATASALKDSNKARRLAEDAGDELPLAKEGADAAVPWQLALQVGRHAMETLAKEPAKRSKPSKPTKPSKPSKPAKRSKPVKPAKALKPKTASRSAKVAKTTKSPKKTKRT